MPEAPLAYFLTFRTYGTWLHGDERGSIDRHHAAPSEPLLPRDDFRRGFATRLMGGHPFVLSDEGRQSADASIRRSCSIRGWELTALNVRTNHVHVLVAANERPERVMSTLKTWTTRDLREAGLAARGQKVWARHGSTRYLWDEESTDAVWRYIVHGQHPEKWPGG